MKECPNCREEMEDSYDLCWNCNYSIIEKKVVKITETEEGDRDINCIRCNIPLKYAGKYKFHEGGTPGFFGNFFELFVNRESFELYVCPRCGKVEFYTSV